MPRVPSSGLIDTIGVPLSLGSVIRNSFEALKEGLEFK